MKRALLLLAVLSAVVFTGCQQLSDFQKNNERTYALSYDADTQSGSVSMTVRPVSPQAVATGQTPPPAMAMDDQTIARFLDLLEKAAKRNAAAGPISPPQPALPVDFKQPVPVIP